MLFIYKLKKLHKRSQLYGVSRININPNFRDEDQIKAEIMSTKYKRKQKLSSFVVKKNKFLFYPNSSFIFFWNMMNLMFILYFLIVMPLLLIFFTSNNFIDYFENFIDICFIVDILINFNTTF